MMGTTSSFSLFAAIESFFLHSQYDTIWLYAHLPDATPPLPSLRAGAFVKQTCLSAHSVTDEYSCTRRHPSKQRASFARTLKARTTSTLT